MVTLPLRWSPLHDMGSLQIGGIMDREGTGQKRGYPLSSQSRRGYERVKSWGLKRKRDGRGRSATTREAEDGEVSGCCITAPPRCASGKHQRHKLTKQQRGATVERLRELVNRNFHAYIASDTRTTREC